MPDKKAKDVESGDVVVDNLGFLRVVAGVFLMPFKVIGFIVRIIFRDDGSSEFHETDYNIHVMDDEYKK